MQAQKVGIREFRERLASILEASNPVAITRHGETVGYYIPAHRNRKDSDLGALRNAAAKLDALLASAGVSDEELVHEFKQSRRSRKARS